MNMFKSASMIALIAVSTMTAAQVANAATLVVSTGTAAVGQVKQGVTNQAADSAALAIGEVRNNSKVSSTAVGLVNSSDIDQTVKGAAATGATSSGNLTASASGSYYDVGNAASQEAGQASMSATHQASAATSGSSSSLIPLGTSNYATSAADASSFTAGGAYSEAANEAWNQGGSFGGNLSASYQLTSLSAEYTMSGLNVSQVVGDSTQTMRSLAGSGDVLDTSTLSSTAAAIANTSTIKVMVDAGCGC